MGVAYYRAAATTLKPLLRLYPPCRRARYSVSSRFDRRLQRVGMRLHAGEDAAAKSSAFSKRRRCLRWRRTQPPAAAAARRSLLRQRCHGAFCRHRRELLPLRCAARHAAASTGAAAATRQARDASAGVLSCQTAGAARNSPRWALQLRSTILPGKTCDRNILAVRAGGAVRMRTTPTRRGGRGGLCAGRRRRANAASLLYCAQRRGARHCLFSARARLSAGRAAFIASSTLTRRWQSRAPYALCRPAGRYRLALRLWRRAACSCATCTCCCLPQAAALLLRETRPPSLRPGKATARGETQRRVYSLLTYRQTRRFAPFRAFPALSALRSDAGSDGWLRRRKHHHRHSSLFSAAIATRASVEGERFLFHPFSLSAAPLRCWRKQTGSMGG